MEDPWVRDALGDAVAQQMDRRAVDGRLQPLSVFFADLPMKDLEDWMTDESRTRLRCCVCHVIPPKHYRTMKRSGVDFQVCCTAISCKGCAERTVRDQACPVCQQDVFAIVDPRISSDLFDMAVFRCCDYRGNRSGLIEHAQEKHDEAHNIILDIARTIVAEIQAEQREFADRMEKFSSDPVVAGLLKAIIERDAARQKQFEDKVSSITIEKNMLHCQLQKKIDDNERMSERMSTTMYNSDETIATLTDSNQKLKKTLATLQKSSRDLARRCSKATQNDIPDLQMQGLCLLTQKAYFAPTDKGRARSRSPRRSSEDVD